MEGLRKCRDLIVLQKYHAVVLFIPYDEIILVLGR